MKKIRMCTLQKPNALRF